MPRKERRGPLNGRTPKGVRVRGGLGTTDLPLPRRKRKDPVTDSASSRAKCKHCGEQLNFTIDKTTTALIRLNEDGTLHIHKDG